MFTRLTPGLSTSLNGHIMSLFGPLLKTLTLKLNYINLVFLQIIVRMDSRYTRAFFLLYLSLSVVFRLSVSEPSTI